MQQPISNTNYDDDLIHVEINGEAYTRVCSRCGCVIHSTTIDDYDWYCPNHDEDLFNFETNLVLDKDLKV